MSPKSPYRLSLLILLPLCVVAFVVAENRGTRRSHEDDQSVSSRGSEITEAEDNNSALGLPEGPPPGVASTNQPDSLLSREDLLAPLKKQIVEEQARLDAARQNIFDLENVLDVPEEAAGWDPDQALLKPSLRKYAEYFKARKVYEQSEQNRRNLYLKLLSESRGEKSPVGGPQIPPPSFPKAKDPDPGAPAAVGNSH